MAKKLHILKVGDIVRLVSFHEMLRRHNLDSTAVSFYGIPIDRWEALRKSHEITVTYVCDNYSIRLNHSYLSYPYEALLFDDPVSKQTIAKAKQYLNVEI